MPLRMDFDPHPSRGPLAGIVCRRLLASLVTASLAVTLLVALAPRAHAAAYMKLGDIKGESIDEGHLGDIDILSYSWGVSNPVTTTGGGTATGKANFQDLTFTKRLDKSSPQLFLACASGKHIPEAIIVLRRSGDDPAPYLEIKMQDVLVSSYSHSGSGGGDSRPTESVSLNFTKITYTYRYTDDTGAAATEEAVWDLATATSP